MGINKNIVDFIKEVRISHDKRIKNSISSAISDLEVFEGAIPATDPGATYTVENETNTTIWSDGRQDGKEGYVPKPTTDDANKFLKGDGTWSTVATDTVSELWIDGVKQEVRNNTVNLDLSTYAKKSDIASVWKRKGSVNSYSNLPTDAEEGDVYNIKTAGGTDGEGLAIKAGDNVVRTTDGKWDVLAGTVNLEGYVEKVTGKQLSTEDFTTSYKNKLDGLSNYTLPSASTSTKGGIKVGNGLAMDGDTLNVTLSSSGTTSNNFTEQVTLSGGFVSDRTSIDVEKSTINATDASISTYRASIDVSNATIRGYMSFLDGTLYSKSTDFDLRDAGIYAIEADIDIHGASIDANDASIVADNGSIHASESSILASASKISIHGSDVYTRYASIDASLVTISGNLEFSGRPVLSGGFVSKSVTSNLSYSTINASVASINMTQASISGNPNFTGKPTLSGGFVAKSIEGNLYCSTIDAMHTDIELDNSYVYACNATIDADCTISGDPVFTGQPEFNNGFCAESVRSHLSHATIKAANSTIQLKNASIRACGASIDAGISNNSSSNPNATILGNPEFNGNPTFTGQVTFTEPIYIDNTGSTVKGALCFDVANNLPRLKMRMNGVDYIFNCDTSVAAGS